MIIPAPPRSTLRTELRGARIRVRRVTLADEGALWTAVRESLGELGEWMSWAGPSYSRDDGRAWLESQVEAWDAGLGYEMIIEDPATGRLLGACGINGIDPLNRRANLGYWVRSSDTGRGVATEAARLVARYGHEELALLRIEILAATANRASQRVAERIGAVREGILRARIVVGDVAQDAVMYSLLPGEVR